MESDLQEALVNRSDDQNLSNLSIPEPNPSDFSFPEEITPEFIQNALKLAAEETFQIVKRPVRSQTVEIKQRSRKISEVLLSKYLTEKVQTKEELLMKKQLEREKNQKLYNQFLQWKAFEHVFDYEDKIILSDASENSEWVAFRLNDKKVVKIVNVLEKSEISLVENEKSPIEFLKFIDEGQMLVLANRILMFTYDIYTNEMRTINLLEIYKQNSFPISEIVSGQVKNYCFAIVQQQYHLHFTINETIFSLTFNLELEFQSFNYYNTRGQIRLFSLSPRFNLIFTVFSVKNSHSLLQVLSANFLQPLKQLHFTNTLVYISHPILNLSKRTLHVKFIGLTLTDLKSLKFSLTIHQSETDILPEIGSAKGKFNTMTKDLGSSFKISKVWLAEEKKIIIESETRYRWTSHKHPRQTIYDGKLERVIREFAVPFTGIKSGHKAILAYRDRTLSVIAIGEDSFESHLEFAGPIEGVRQSSNFILVYHSGLTSCWMIKESKSRISKHFDEKDFEKVEVLDPDLKNNLANILCTGRDSKNLSYLLKYKNKFNLKSEIEGFCIEDSFIGGKSTECTKLLLNYYIGLNEDLKNTESLLEDIENNFNLIVTCDSPNLVKFIDSLLSSTIAVGTVIENDEFLFNFYKNKSETIGQMFFYHENIAGSEYEMQNTIVKLPDLNGSLDSIELSAKLINCNIKLFKSKLIQFYIQKKWIDLWPIVLMETLMHWTNCFIIIYLFTNEDNYLIVLPAFIGINAFLAFGEVIQVINLGMAKYIGLENIHYYGNAGILIAIFIVYDSYNWIMFYFFSQLLSAFFDVKHQVHNVCLKIVPFLLILTSQFFFTRKELFGFIFLYETIMAFYYAAIGPTMKISLCYLKITSFITIYGFASYDSNDSDIVQIALISLLGLVFLLERFDEIYELRSKFFQIKPVSVAVVELLTISSLVAGFFMHIKLCFEIALAVSIIVQLLVCYDNSFKYPQWKRDFFVLSINYSVYLIFLFSETHIGVFQLFFIAYVCLDFAYLKNYSLRQSVKELKKFLFNWNIIDILRTVITFYWIVLYLVGSEIREIFDWSFVTLNLIRGLTGFRAFNVTRFYIGLIFQSVYDISSFLLILIYMNVALGIVLFAASESLDSFDNNFFILLWVKPFDSIFGNIDQPTEFSIKYISFFIGNLLMVVIMLNMLISIFSNTFQKFQVTSVEQDYKEMINAIYECEILLFWRARNRSKAYFAICSRPEAKAEKDRAVEKISAMERKVSSMQKNMEKELINSQKEMENRFVEAVKKMEKKFEKKQNELGTVLESQLQEIKELLRK